MTFAQPYWLLLLLLLPALIFWYRRSAQRRHVSLMVSRWEAMAVKKTWVVYARNWLQWVRWVVMALLIIALARPQLLWQEEKTEAEAIDIMLTVDVSESMLSQDFEPDRLSAVKDWATTLVNQRKYDRIGLTVFAGGAFNQCPLTRDHRILKAFINNMQVGRLPEGTALGTGLATSIRHMKDSATVSKVVLLLTDGEHNTGAMAPLQAAAIAKALGVRVYVIGIGKDGQVASPIARRFDDSYSFGMRPMRLDTLGLSAVAAAAGGRFFRVKSVEDLKGVYQEIDQLEKSKISVTAVRRTTELFFWFLNAAISLLALELLLRWGPLRVITV